MNDFERQYYENDDFWKDSLQDADNRNRIERTASLIPNGIKTLADLGCGNGVFLNLIKRQRPELDLLGVDRSVAALKYVKTKTLQGSIDELPFADNSFECTTCLEVIEHLPIDVYEKALAEIARVSSQYVIISVPYNEVLEDSFNQCPQCRTSFSYEMHLRSFDDQRMDHLLKRFGFECVSKEYLGEQIRLAGYSSYRKLIHSEQLKRFVSPICPVCGYQNHDKELGSHLLSEPVNSVRRITRKQKFTSLITAIPKLFWPKKKSYYWILCLYKKSGL